MLEANIASGVLILVRAVYVQRDNREQLSIYLGCDFLEPQRAKLVAAELVDSSGINLEAGEIDLDCPDSKLKVNSLKGGGYIHFYGETIPKLTLDKNLLLLVSIKAKDTICELNLPLTTSKVWVWPT
ncbi:hypothetical protein ACG1BZ_09345 [Microbulbifer sp. CNSA002]|uniref:hypothetical protein n=1 Tax=Microbulbifer sp. CNSA002 TaxID=3373604 RepID=UPI0039B5F53C